MHRCTRHLYAIRQCRLVHMQPIEALTAEGRNQRGMHIYDTLRVCSCKVFAEDGHKACQNNHINAIFRKNRLHGFLIRKLCFKFFALYHNRRDIVFCRSCQCISLIIACQHQCDFAAGDFPSFCRINQCLQICAAAGNEYGNLCLRQ